MLLYFMRHGEAEDATAGQSDYRRELTARGVKRTLAAAKVLRRLEALPALILTSPLVRARQTADTIAGELNVPVVEEAGLACGCSLDRLAELLERHDARGPLMVVGHEPDFSLMIGELIGRGRVEMKKGGIACLAVQGLARGGAVLQWLMPGKELAELG